MSCIKFWRIAVSVLAVALIPGGAGATSISSGRIITDGMVLYPHVVPGGFLAGWTGQLDLVPFLVSDITNPDGLAARMCMPCQPGEMADIGWSGIGLYWYAPTAVVGSETYAPLYFSGQFEVHGSFRLPDPPVLDPSFTIGGIPFTYRINLRAYVNDPTESDPGPPLFHILVLGSGTANVELGSYEAEGSFYDWRGTTYDLLEGQAIPEPASFSLMAVGLLLLATCRVRVRRERG
jgi:hypothetical protein